MLIFVRHGATSSNEIGHEKLRGWLPIPVTLEGMHEVQRTAEALSEMEGGVDAIYCGTLVRVVQSASEIAMAMEMELQPKDEFNDWNTGDFAGEPVQETLKDLHSHIRSPEKPVPNGESFQQFLDRIVPELKALVEDDNLNILVSSGRVSTLLNSLKASGGEKPDVQILLGKPPIDPAGVFILDNDWTVVFQTKKDAASKGLS